MSGKLSESDKKMVTDQVAIRATWPNHTTKWLARLMRIPLSTARFWTERTVPVYRQNELGLLLIKQFYERRKWEDEKLLPALHRMAGLVNEVKMVPAPPSIANTAADLVGAAAGRVAAAIDWLKTEGDG
jgi:hypothetical protein